MKKLFILLALLFTSVACFGNTQKDETYSISVGDSVYYNNLTNINMIFTGISSINSSKNNFKIDFFFLEGNKTLYPIYLNVNINEWYDIVLPDGTTILFKLKKEDHNLISFDIDA
mgnify:CR=1 FL=1